MAQPNIIEDNADPAQKIYPDLHVVDEEALISAVHEGIASLEEGRLTDHATLMAELNQIIHGKA